MVNAVWGVENATKWDTDSFVLFVEIVIQSLNLRQLINKTLYNWKRLEYKIFYELSKNIKARIIRWNFQKQIQFQQYSFKH